MYTFWGTKSKLACRGGTQFDSWKKCKITHLWYEIGLSFPANGKLLPAVKRKPPKSFSTLRNCQTNLRFHYRRRYYLFIFSANLCIREFQNRDPKLYQWTCVRVCPLWATKRQNQTITETAQLRTESRTLELANDKLFW